MTPERGIELLQRGQDENGRVDVFEALSVVLAACAEERKAALTEAAESCCTITGVPPSDMTEDQIMTAHATARCIRRDIEALRDREPR